MNFAKLNFSKKSIAYFCLLVVCILWGTTWVASSWTVRQGVSALQVAAFRQLIGGSLLCAGILIYNRGKVKLPPLRDLILLAILNFIFSNGLSTWGVQYVPAGMASIIAATYPLWMVIIYTIYFKRQITTKVWVGMIFALIGLIIVFFPVLKYSRYEENFLFGLWLTIVSTATWALGTIYTKIQTEQDVDPYFSIGLQMLISGVALTTFQILFGHYTPIADITGHVWMGILYLVIAGSLISFSCFIYALKNLPAEQVSVYAYINPIVALITSNIFMGEQITSLLIIGGAIVLSGVYLINQAYKV